MRAACAGWPHRRFGSGESEVASVDDFLAYLQIERQVSAHTLDAYQRDLAALVSWAGEQAIDDVAQAR